MRKESLRASTRLTDPTRIPHKYPQNDTHRVTALEVTGTAAKPPHTRPSPPTRPQRSHSQVGPPEIHTPSPTRGQQFLPPSKEHVPRATLSATPRQVVGAYTTTMPFAVRAGVWNQHLRDCISGPSKVSCMHSTVHPCECTSMRPLPSAYYNSHPEAARTRCEREPRASVPARSAPLLMKHMRTRVTLYHAPLCHCCGQQVGARRRSRRRVLRTPVCARRPSESPN